MNDGFDFLPSGTLLEDDRASACGCGGGCGGSCAGECGCGSQGSGGAGCAGSKRSRPGEAVPHGVARRRESGDGAWQGLGVSGGDDGLLAQGPRHGDPRRGAGRGVGLGAVPGRATEGASPLPWRWQDFEGEIWDPRLDRRMPQGWWESAASRRSDPARGGPGGRGDDGCPEICLRNYRDAEACLENLHRVPPEHVDEMRRLCGLYREAYARCLASYVYHEVRNCPDLSESPELPQVPVHPGLGGGTCGPDVTDWLLRAIATSLQQVPPYDVMSWPLWSPYGPFDLKQFGPKSGDCPSGHCDYTATLCGWCVRLDVPANIGAAFVMGRNTLEWLGWGDAFLLGGEEDAWDLSAYDAGLLASRLAARSDAFSWQFIPDLSGDINSPMGRLSSDEPRLRNALCHAIDLILFSDFMAGTARAERMLDCRQCVPCGRKWPTR